MSSLRRLLLDHRALAALIFACALAMKVIVPTGFMIGTEGGRITIELCSGMEPMDSGAMAAMVMPGTMPGMDHKQDKPDHQGKEMPCAFSALTASSLAATDAVLLAAAILFIVATVFRVAATRPVRARSHVRPPLRGPPATA